MTASANTTHSQAGWLRRLIISLSVGLMMLALGASSVFAGTGHQATAVAGNAAPVISTGDKVTLDADDDEDDDDDDDEEGGGGGGLPATDTAPLASTSTGTPMPAVALLVIAGLAGGAVTVAAKRPVRS